MLKQFTKSVKFLGHAQDLLPEDSSSTTTYGKENAIVYLNSSITLPIISETINTKGGVLTSSVMAFLNLGPDVLKGADNDLPNVKTKINNEVNNVTQIVMGAKSTNAVMQVEISKALASIVALLGADETDIITINAISICKTYAACDNAVTIK